MGMGQSMSQAQETQSEAQLTPEKQGCTGGLLRLTGGMCHCAGVGLQHR
jgi:hypothetical protein